MKSSSLTSVLLFFVGSSVHGQPSAAPSVAPSLAPMSSSSSDTPTLVPSLVLPDSNAAIPSLAPSRSVSPSKEDDAAAVPSFEPTTNEAAFPSFEPTNEEAAFPSFEPTKEEDVVAIPVSAPVFVSAPTPNVTERAECSAHAACAGLSGLCCPTLDAQYLDCCSGFQEDTCSKNERCAALGLLGTCCPTAGHRRPEFNDIWLDCCDAQPDACSTTNRTAKRTAGASNDTAEPCVRMSAVEYQEKLATASSAGAAFTTTTTMRFFSAFVLGLSLMGV